MMFYWQLQLQSMSNLNLIVSVQVIEFSTDTQLRVFSGHCHSSLASKVTSLSGHTPLCALHLSRIYTSIKSMKDDAITLLKRAAKVNEAMKHNYYKKLLNRVFISTAKDLDVLKMEYCEDQMVRRKR